MGFAPVTENHILSGPWCMTARTPLTSNLIGALTLPYSARTVDFGVTADASGNRSRRGQYRHRVSTARNLVSTPEPKERTVLGDY